MLRGTDRIFHSYLNNRNKKCQKQVNNPRRFGLRPSSVKGQVEVHAHAPRNINRNLTPTEEGLLKPETSRIINLFLVLFISIIEVTLERLFSMQLRNKMNEVQEVGTRIGCCENLRPPKIKTLKPKTRKLIPEN